MRYSSSFVLIVAVSAIFIGGETAYSQSIEKFEVGGVFSVLRTSVPTLIPSPNVVCAGPCLVVLTGPRQSQSEVGFGGRFGYNISSAVALEAEVNFFPDADSFGVDETFRDGHRIQGLFGAKVGKRFDKVGIFGKTRPGFLSASNGSLEPLRDTGCITIFPPPAACFEPVRQTHFAFDLGGVVEIYPTKRTIIRFDAGDTIVHAGARTIPVAFSLFVTAAQVPAETTHNFQASVGLSFRF